MAKRNKPKKSTPPKSSNGVEENTQNPATTEPTPVNEENKKPAQETNPPATTDGNVETTVSNEETNPPAAGDTANNGTLENGTLETGDAYTAEQKEILGFVADSDEENQSSQAQPPNPESVAPVLVPAVNDPEPTPAPEPEAPREEVATYDLVRNAVGEDPDSDQHLLGTLAVLETIFDVLTKLQPYHPRNHTFSDIATSPGFTRLREAANDKVAERGLEADIGKAKDDFVSSVVTALDANNKEDRSDYVVATAATLDYIIEASQNEDLKPELFQLSF